MPIVTVDNRVRVSAEGLSEESREKLRDAFTHENPGEANDGGPVYYRTWKNEGNGDISFPRGGMSRVREILRATVQRYTVADHRSAGSREFLDDDWGGEPIPKHKVELWDFQERIVEAVLKKHNCIVEAITGSGKSTAALAIASRLNLSTLVIVNAGGLRDQWIKRAAKELGIHTEDIGIIGDGKRRTTPFTIAMQQTLKNGIAEEWMKAFGLIVCDEVDLFAAPTFFASVDPWPAMYRVGVTSTVERHDKKEFMVYDLFGDIVAEVTEEEALEKNRIVDVEIRIVPTRFTAPWYKAALASGNKFRIRNSFHKYLHALAEDEGRNKIICDLVKAEVKNDEQVMVLSLRREHCFDLDRAFTERNIRSGVMLGGNEDKREFKRSLEGIQNRTLSVVVGTEKAIGRGQDFPVLSVGVMTMPIAKNVQLVQQVKGRLCRACEEIGKTGGILYYLWDRSIQGKKAVETLVKNNRSVVVKDEDGSWVDGKTYLARMRGGIKDGGLTETVTAEELMGSIGDQEIE